jgi:riboflavin transporter FmnP
MNRNSTVMRIAVMGMMGALSILLVVFIHFPLFPGAAFLEYDPADIPILVCTFIYGPLNGLLLTVVVSVVQGVTVSAQSGVIGIVMHVLATGVLVLVAGTIYHRKKSWKTAVGGVVAGALAMTATMVFWNIIFTPIFMGMPRSAVYPMLLPIIIPFNMLKAGINGAVTLVTYRHIEKFVVKQR